MILTRKWLGTVSCLTPSMLVTFPSALPGVRSWSCPELWHHWHLPFLPNPSFKPATLKPWPLLGQKIFSRTPSDFLMTSKPLFHYPLANYPLAFLLFSSILDSRTHHNNPFLANTLSTLAALCLSSLPGKTLVLFKLPVVFSVSLAEELYSASLS